MEARKQHERRQGTWALAGLALLLLVSCTIAAALRRGALLPIAVVAIAQAWIMLRSFMQIQQLWRGDT